MITRVTEIVAVLEKTDAGVKPDDVRALDAHGESTGIGFFPDSSRWFLGTRSQILLMEADGESGAMKRLAALSLPKPVVQLHLVGRDRFLAFNCDTTVTLYRLEW